MGSHIRQIRVDRKVRQAAAEREERFFRVAIVLVLADGVLNGLAGQRIFQFGSKDRQAVEKQSQVKALLVGFAVFELANGGKEIRLVKSLQFLIEPARRPEIGQSKRAPIRLDPFTEHLQRPTRLDLGGQARQHAFFGVAGMVPLELLPFFRLGRVDEVQDIGWNQTEPLVVIVRTAFPIATGLDDAVLPALLSRGTCATRPLLWGLPDQHSLDCLLKVLFGNINHSYAQGPPAGQCDAKVSPLATASVGGMRNASSCGSTCASASPCTSSPARLRKPFHCACLSRSPEKSTVKHTGGRVGNEVFRRSKVLRMAFESASPRKSHRLARNQRAKKSFIRLLATPSSTID